MIRRLISLALLGWRTAWYYLTRPFRRQRMRGEQFIERFVPDNLLPMEPATRDLLVQAARCTGCCLCDARCAIEARLPAGQPGPSFVVLSLVRSLPDLTAARGDLGLYRGCMECRECEAWCAYGIPIMSLVEGATSLLDKLDRRRASMAD